MIRSAWKTLWRYLRAPTARTAQEFGDSIEEELAFHLSERTREFTQRGMSPEEAKRTALERFGSPARVAAQCHAAAIGGLAWWHRLHLGMTALLVLAVGVLWFTAPRPGDVSLMPASSIPPGIRTMLDHDWTGDVAGQILDEHGKPIDGAHVLVVVKTWPDQSYFQRAYAARSDREGRFLIENVHPVNERFEVQIAAMADNRALKSSYHTRSNGKLESIVLALPPAPGLALQVETARGTTLAGVEVLPHGRIDEGGDEHLVYFDSAQSFVRRTDAKGRVELPYFTPGDMASVLVRMPQGDWESRKLVVPAAGEVARILTAEGN